MLLVFAYLCGEQSAYVLTSLHLNYLHANYLLIIQLFHAVGWSNQIYLSEKKNIKFPDSSYYKNGSCFVYLCELLSKLQMFKVTNFMTFSDGLLICVILLINHTHLIFSIFSWS